MKNLKKVLSLGLASSMLMGMMVIGAGAATTQDYTDANDITYVQAVDVMSSIGVFNGTDSGDFQPNGDLTRETAAKIITYMLLGQTAADKLSTTSAPFEDVPANKWSAGSIAYCVDLGIIAGDGNGYFYPSQSVDGYSFAKMLLVALGYDATIEGYVGSNWAISVASDALAADLDTDLDVALSNTLTREQACQMAFNTLKATMVKYDSKGTNITTSDGTTVVVGASSAEAVYGYEDTIIEDSYMQFGEQYFENLECGGTSDPFGRVAEKWSLSADTIGVYSVPAELTYTGGVTPETIYDDLGLSTDVAEDDVTVIYDGQPESNDDDDYNQYATLTITDDDDDTYIGGNGITTEVFSSYDSDEKVVKVSLVLVSDRFGIVNDSDEDEGIIEIDGNEFESAAFDVDDYVIYTATVESDGVIDNIMSVSLASAVSGTMTSYTGTSKLVVDGSTYRYANEFTGDYASAFGTNSDVTLYLTDTGYVIYMEGYEDSVSSNYAYVLDTGSVLDAYGKNSYYAKLVYADGTVESVETVGDYSGNTNDDYPDLTNVFVSAKTKTSGLVVLNAVSATANGFVTDVFTITSGVSKINSTLYGNSSTIYLVNDGESITSYTGFANVPSIDVNDDDGGFISALKKSSSVASMIYIDLGDGDLSTGVDQIIYVVGNPYASVTNDGELEYYTFTAVIDGEVTTLLVDVNDENVSTLSESYVGLMFDNVSYDSDGIATLGDTAGNVAQHITKVSGGTIGLGSTEDDLEYYSYSDDCVVYFISAKGVVSESSVSSITTKTHKNISYFLEDGEICAIFIQRS